MSDHSNEALGLSLDGDCNYWILGYTGTYFHGQIGEAGLNGEEASISFPKEIGYFVLEKGKVWQKRDWETGIIDDYGLDGPTRPALYEDFVKFGVEPPEMLQVMREDMKKLYDMIEFISPDDLDFFQKTAEKYGLDADDSISIIELEHGA